MNRFIYYMSALLLSLSISGCVSNRYSIYQYDNGDDYICEGVRRIVDAHGRIGYADEKGSVVIRPRFAFAFPFENGMAKATMNGYSVNEGEHSRWISPDWFYIDHKGKVIKHESF